MSVKFGEQEIEDEIQAKRLNAPRLTPAHLDTVIAGEQYHMFPGTTLTVCCLTLKNGFTVLGQSAAASPENFDAELGRKIARADARDKIWMLEGYLLRERLHEKAVAIAAPIAAAHTYTTACDGFHPLGQQCNLPADQPATTPTEVPLWASTSRPRLSPAAPRMPRGRSAPTSPPR